MRYFYLWTIGCQMNDADATRVSQGLKEMDLRPTAEPREADLVVLITCVVRQSAENRVVGRLTSLKQLKRHRPLALTVVMGCFVHDEGTLQATYPWVDAFFKPSQIDELLGFVREGMPGDDTIPCTLTHASPSAVCAYVPISFGCNHHCTYCIVRLRRGIQQSRPLADIADEAQRMADAGIRQITLLGQNVDAYGQDLGLGAPDLADVLQVVHQVSNLRRIRFLTSHPADMSQRVIQAVAGLPRVCPHFELAVQAGNDRVLRRMGRSYAIADFRTLIDSIRAQIPLCSIATDIIVGFPGETRQEFQDTYDLVASTRFDVVHVAKYSPRPGTPAAQLPDDIAPGEKEWRRAQLDQLQERISAEINDDAVGQIVEVLIERRQRGRWRGRTVSNKLVFFEDPDNWRGRLARVCIHAAGPWSLRGEVVRQPALPSYRL